MEKGLHQVDFATVDSLIQVHDYDGVSMTSRDAESKKAAAEATKIFQDHYPELLVRAIQNTASSCQGNILTILICAVSFSTTARQVLCQRSDADDMDILVVQTTRVCTDLCQTQAGGRGPDDYWKGDASVRQRGPVAQEIRWGKVGLNEGGLVPILDSGSYSVATLLVSV